MNILLNIAPFELTADQRETILRCCPRTDVRILTPPIPQQVDAYDGSDVDVLVTGAVPSDLTGWPALRWVQLLSAGADHLDGHAIWQRDLIVTTASGIHAAAMAQYSTCALLMLSSGMPTALRYGASRKWSVRDTLYLRDQIWQGKTVGIVGYGSIGRECARQLQALGMRVVCMTKSGCKVQRNRFLGWPGTGDPEGRIPEAWFTPEKLGEMLPACDVLLITAPRTAATMGMIGRAQLALMKPTARIIIISRGGIVDETALAEALRAGTLGGAVIDSFAEEPPPDTHPLFGAPHTILTPHISGGFGDYWPTLCRLFCENLGHFVAGRSMLNSIRPTP